jgi:hypothetical protein
LDKSVITGDERAVRAHYSICYFPEMGIW